MDSTYLTLAILTLISAIPSLDFSVQSVWETAGDHDRAVVARPAATRLSAYSIALAQLGDALVVAVQRHLLPGEASPLGHRELTAGAGVQPELSSCTQRARAEHRNAMPA